eukprot:PITA_31605
MQKSKQIKTKDYENEEDEDHFPTSNQTDSEEEINEAPEEEITIEEKTPSRNEESMSQNFASVMQQEFEMSLLGELTYFLGLQVQQNKDGIFLSQTKYLKQILKKYGMEDSKLVCTPMVTGCSVNSDDESTAIHQPTYKSMIGNLLYLTGTRPDIMHVVGIVGRFQANPKETHL